MESSKSTKDIFLYRARWTKEPYLIFISRSQGKLFIRFDKSRVISVAGNENILLIIDIFKNHATHIQLVITDIVIPLMEGNELIKVLKDIKPDIKIIVVSGYCDEKVNKDRLIDAFVRKPLEGAELLSTVRQILDTGIRKLPLY